MPLILDGTPSPPATKTAFAAPTAAAAANATADAKTADAKTADANEARRRLHHEADVVIVGAGIVGCAAAVAFGKQGRSVILLEKSLKEPDRIVGELLQPGGCSALRELGLGECLEGIDAVPCEGYDVIYYKDEVRIPYPKEGGERPEGRAFHHGRFIRKLREAAAATPGVMVVETEARELVRNGWTGQVLGVECLTEKKKDFYFGHITLIADGYNSKFRKQNHPHKPSVRSKFFALELIDCALPMPHHGHVVMGDGPPVLLYQIGTHETRALVDIPDGLPSASVKNGGVKGHLEKVVLPSLPPSVQPSFKLAMEQGKLRSMPNSFLPPATNRIPGLVIVGDAMNMRHPLTGGGMTVAFNDVVLLAELLDPAQVPFLGDMGKVLTAMRAFHWQRKNWAAVINILALALYALFSANDASLRALQLGCFRYFQRGGNCVDGPVGLLAGIVRQPFVLFYHFFAVALYAIWIRIRDAGSVVGMPWRAVSSVAVFWKACVVIFPYIWCEVLP